MILVYGKSHILEHKLKLFFALVGIFSVPTTTASAATETETMSIAATKGTYSNNDQMVTWTGTNFTYTHNKGSSTSALYKTDTSYFRAYANTNGYYCKNRYNFYKNCYYLY